MVTFMGRFSSTGSLSLISSTRIPTSIWACCGGGGGGGGEGGDEEKKGHEEKEKEEKVTVDMVAEEEMMGAAGRDRKGVALEEGRCG